MVGCTTASIPGWLWTGSGKASAHGDEKNQRRQRGPLRSPEQRGCGQSNSKERGERVVSIHNEPACMGGVCVATCPHIHLSYRLISQCLLHPMPAIHLYLPYTSHLSFYHTATPSTPIFSAFLCPVQPCGDIHSSLHSPHHSLLLVTS